MSVKPFKVPVTGTIVKWCKTEGDKLSAGDILCEVQTDNGSKSIKCAQPMEVDDDAILDQIYLQSGQVSEGQLIAMIKMVHVTQKIFDIKMPQFPDMTEGTIVKWYKTEGDKLSAGEVICVVNLNLARPKFETIKAATDGVLDMILVKNGESCQPDGLIGMFKDPTKSLQEVTKSHMGKASTVIEIRNLDGKFKKDELVQLLKRTGNFDEQRGIWINRFNVHALVKFNTEAEAKDTLCALNGVKWPSSNQKKLIVTFSSNKFFQNKMKHVGDKSKDSNKGNNGKGGKGQEVNVKSGTTSYIDHLKRLKANGKFLTGKQMNLLRKAEKEEEDDDVFFIAPMSKIEHYKKKLMKKGSK